MPTDLLTAALADRLVEWAKATLPSDDQPLPQWNSGVYAVVDCVFSAQARYYSVVWPMLTERLPLRPGLCDEVELTFSAFLADVESFGPEPWDAYGDKVLNLQVLAGRRKVEVCHEIARFFVDRGFETRGELRELGDDGIVALVLGPLQQSIRGIGPALARYLTILLGVEGQMKPDIMITRFFEQLTRAAGLGTSAPSIPVIEEVMTRAASELGTTPARLDNAIWQHMSSGGQVLPDPPSTAPIGEEPAAVEIAGPDPDRRRPMAPTFRRVAYSTLNSRQKESYNFHKLAAELADFGFTCMRLADDWEGADFLAVHYLGDSVLKVQLKGRLTIASKYEGKDLWIAFPHQGGWYLVQHDRLVEIVGEVTGFLETLSWESGVYSTARPSKALLEALQPYCITRIHSMHPIDSAELESIQHRLHDLIRRRAGHLEDFDEVELPDLSDASEVFTWFPVPGMYGGFKYTLAQVDGHLELDVESWSRVGEGSGQRHRVTADSCELLEEGFV